METITIHGWRDARRRHLDVVVGAPAGVDGAPQENGLRGQDVPVAVRQQIGDCLVSSSSLAVGLTIQIRSAFPDYAATVTGIVLAAVMIFELIGPLLTRRALLVTREAQTMPAPPREAHDVSPTV